MQPINIGQPLDQRLNLPEADEVHLDPGPLLLRRPEKVRSVDDAALTDELDNQDPSRSVSQAVIPAGKDSGDARQHSQHSAQRNPDQAVDLPLLMQSWHGSAVSNGRTRSEAMTPFPAVNHQVQGGTRARPTPPALTLGGTLPALAGIHIKYRRSGPPPQFGATALTSAHRVSSRCRPDDQGSTSLSLPAQ